MGNFLMKNTDDFCHLGGSILLLVSSGAIDRLAISIIGCLANREVKTYSAARHALCVYQALEMYIYSYQIICK